MVNEAPALRWTGSRLLFETGILEQIPVLAERSGKDTCEENYGK
jgi:hypothetical protein